MTRLFPLALLLLAVPAVSVAAPVPKQALTKEQEAEFDRLWDQVRAGDMSHPSHLYCRLVQEPQAAVAYLTKTLKPAKMDEKEAKELIAALDSKEEAVWRRAYRDLQLRDYRLAMTGSDGWEEAKSDIQKWRLGNILAGGWDVDEDRQGITVQLEPPNGRERDAMLRKQYDNGGAYRFRVTESFPPKEWVRPSVTVSIAVLERINTPAARKHLSALAEGHEDAGSTREAAAALDRLNRGAGKVEVKIDGLWRGQYAYLAGIWNVAALLDRPREAVSLFKANMRPVKLTADGAKKLLTQLFSDDAKEVRAALRELMVVDLRLGMDFTAIWKEAKTPAHRCRLVDAMHIWNTRTNPTYGEIADDFDIDERNKCLDYKLSEGIGIGGRVAGWSVAGIWRADIAAEDRPKNAQLPIGVVIEFKKGEIHPKRWVREEVAIYILDAIGTDDALALIKDMATGHPDAGPTKAAKAVLARRGK